MTHLPMHRIRHFLAVVLLLALTAVAGCRQAPQADGAASAADLEDLIAQAAHKAETGDYAGARAAYTAMLDTPGGLPAAQKAWVLYGRAAACAGQNDIKGSVADLDALLGLDGAPADVTALAHLARGEARAIRGKVRAAMTDLGAVIDSADAPAAVRAEALIVRASGHRQTGNPIGALADYRAVLALPGVPDEMRTWVEGALRAVEGPAPQAPSDGSSSQ